MTRPLTPEEIARLKYDLGDADEKYPLWLSMFIWLGLGLLSWFLIFVAVYALFG